jgi:SAM-dependent methyltransferase
MLDSQATAYDRFADYYDLMVGDRQAYLDFYCSLVKPGHASLIDLGCGTGTVTAAMALTLRNLRQRRAIRVVGIDGSPAMLKVAMARDPDIQWVEEDLRLQKIQGPFDLATSCYHTLQHLNSNELITALAAIRRIIAARGRFAFDIYRPNLPYIRIPQRNRLAREVVDPDGRCLEVREDSEFDEASRVLTIVWRLIDAAHPDERPLVQTRYQAWQHEPDDIERALENTGFRIAERFGDLDRSGYVETSKKQVIVCQPQ